MSNSLPPSESGLPKIGEVLAGKYELERLLGRGGMGAVFAAKHKLLHQRVAIKLVLGNIAQHKEARDRFMNEARAAFAIQSEHIARVLDIGELDTGVPYMVMEYLEGADLSHILEQRGPLPIQEAVDYVMQALDAIAQAHSKGIIHRDLKPANLFIVRAPDGPGNVKVLDFGISKMTNPLAPDSGGMTSTKAMLGSPYYMSPEQLRSSKTVDARTDVWAIGIILHELLTGEVPYKGENLGELFASILEQDAPPVRQRRPDAPPELERILLTCLQRKPDGRYPNVWELAKELVRFGTSRSAAAFERIKQIAPSLPRPTSTAMPAASTQGMPQGFHPPAAPTIQTGNSGIQQAPVPPQATTPFQMQQAQANAPVPVATPPGIPGAGPIPQHTAAGGWGGQTGTGRHSVPVPKKSPIGLIVGGIAAVFVLGIGVTFVAVKATSKPTGSDHPPATSSVATAAPTESASTTPTNVATNTPPPATADLLTPIAEKDAGAAVATNTQPTSKPTGTGKTPPQPTTKPTATQTVAQNPTATTPPQPTGKTPPPQPTATSTGFNPLGDRKP
jgi:serine/threonine-protein kinase